MVIASKVDQLRRFIAERENIYRLKEAGRPKPWTKDAILRSYRFCNVCREWDTETRWIATYWRDPNAGHEDLWFAMFVARVFNWRETLDEIGLPLPFSHAYAEKLRNVIDRRMASGAKTWSNAYIVSTNGVPMVKHDYFVDVVFKPAWENRKVIRPRIDDSLSSFSDRLLDLTGVSGFMAGQIVADTKFVGNLRNAPDWWTWCLPGPGSSRGLNRLTDLPLDSRWRQREFNEEILALREKLDYYVDGSLLSAQDLQNCLCEFDKYERVRFGEGRPKSRYDGG